MLENCACKGWQQAEKLTQKGKIRRLLLEIMSDCTVRAWNMVLMKIIMNSFLETGIINALNGNEDNMMCGLVTKMWMHKG
jgi:hypothetical protein